MHPAVFIDRDNTINIDHGYSPQLEVFDDVVPFLSAMSELGIPVICISNQSGIGRGMIRYGDVTKFNRDLDNLLLDLNPKACISHFYWCPHTPEDNCCCRKPSPGLIYMAAIENNIDLKKSVMIGDKLTDCISGANAGTQHILVDREKKKSGFDSRIRVVKSLIDAIRAVKWLCIDSHST